MSQFSLLCRYLAKAFGKAGVNTQGERLSRQIIEQAGERAWHITPRLFWVEVLTPPGHAPSMLTGGCCAISLRAVVLCQGSTVKNGTKDDKLQSDLTWCNVQAQAGLTRARFSRHERGHHPSSILRPIAAISSCLGLSVVSSTSRMNRASEGGSDARLLLQLAGMVELRGCVGRHLRTSQMKD